MATYIKIATVEVGAGGSANFDFTVIPSTYTDLVLKVCARLTAATDFGSMAISLNGSSSSFTSKLLQGDGSAAVSASLTTYAGGVGGTSLTASTFNSVDFYFPNYAGSTNKSYSIDSVVENNATATRTTLTAGLWSNTAAITQITLTPSSGNFAQYSSATLYGISKS